MRCMLCGEEMRLVQSVPDETMLVPGFEHHILSCPCCHDEERRLVFIRQPPPIQAEGIDRDFLDATLQPGGETAATQAAPPESGSISSAGRLPIESTRLPLASPTSQSSTSRNARAATSRVWDRRAALHRARWKALCDRLGLRVGGEKADAPTEK
jgi:hypothetical protein